MNLKRVSVRNEILIRRDLTVLNIISHVNTKCRSGLKLNPDSCKLPLIPLLVQSIQFYLILMYVL